MTHGQAIKRTAKKINELNGSRKGSPTVFTASAGVSHRLKRSAAQSALGGHGQRGVTALNAEKLF
jgi:hypothetical protein